MKAKSRCWMPQRLFSHLQRLEAAASRLDRKPRRGFYRAGSVAKIFDQMMKKSV
jgi:hypothetical protein